MAQRSPLVRSYDWWGIRPVALSSADFIQHYHQVRDAWGGVRTPDRR